MAFWKPKPGESDGDTEKELLSPEVKEPESPKDSLEAKSSSEVKDEAKEIPDESKTEESSNSESEISKRFGKLRSALSEGTVIQGKLSFDTPVRIDGKLKGEIFSSAALIVGEKGQIDAEMTVQSLLVMGEVKGKVKASDRIEVFPGGNLDAEVQTNVLTIAEGSRLNGPCKMGYSNIHQIDERIGEKKSDDKKDEARTAFKAS